MFGGKFVQIWLLVFVLDNDWQCSVLNDFIGNVISVWIVIVFGGVVWFYVWFEGNGLVQLELISCVQICNCVIDWQNLMNFIEDFVVL